MSERVKDVMQERKGSKIIEKISGIIPQSGRGESLTGPFQQKQKKEKNMDTVILNLIHTYFSPNFLVRDPFHL